MQGESLARQHPGAGQRDRPGADTDDRAAKPQVAADPGKRARRCRGAVHRPGTNDKRGVGRQIVQRPVDLQKDAAGTLHGGPAFGQRSGAIQRLLRQLVGDPQRLQCRAKGQQGELIEQQEGIVTRGMNALDRKVGNAKWNFRVHHNRCPCMIGGMPRDQSRG